MKNVVKQSIEDLRREVSGPGKPPRPTDHHCG